MIRVWVRKDGGKASSYRVEGHAGWAESGSDIVCAAVSALCIGAANGLAEVASAVERTRQKEGYLEVRLKKSLEGEQAAKADAIIETMLLALKDIMEQYPGRIEIYD